MSEKEFEKLVKEVLSLSPSEQKRLIERVTPTLEQHETEQSRRKRSLLRLCADLGPAPRLKTLTKLAAKCGVTSHARTYCSDSCDCPVPHLVMEGDF